MTRTKTVRPLAPTFAAEIAGIDIVGTVSAMDFAEFRDLLHRFHVVIVSGIDLDPADLVGFSRHFGRLEIHSRVDCLLPGHDEVFCVGNFDRDGIKASFNRGIEQWHSDSSFREVPSAASLFYGKIVPPTGGDTIFADATAAYRDLPADLKRDIDNLRCVHSLDTLNAWNARHNPDRAVASPRDREYPAVSQPLVRTHHETGEKSLFLCPAVIREIEGMEATAGAAMIESLMAHTAQPRYVYRHHWRQGDLVVWDNHAVLHTASLFDHTRYERLMFRTTVAGRA